MLADGNWWQSGWTTQDEILQSPDGGDGSLSTVAAVVGADETPLAERRFGWMPFPKPTEEQVGQPTTLYDCLSSAVFLSAKTSEEKQPLAKEFLRFLCTDESLKEYALSTNASVALDIPLNETEFDSLSYFGKTVLQMQMNADMVWPYSTNPLFLNNENYFTVKQAWRATYNPMTPTQYPAEAFRKNNVSVVDYFKGMCEYRKNSWATLKATLKTE
jgi:ABC-type glycerol-3-phosphate transport system substrate-binding protein